MSLYKRLFKESKDEQRLLELYEIDKTKLVRYRDIMVRVFDDFKIGDCSNFDEVILVTRLGEHKECFQEYKDAITYIESLPTFSNHLPVSEHFDKTYLYSVLRKDYRTMEEVGKISQRNPDVRFKRVDEKIAEAMQDPRYEEANEEIAIKMKELFERLERTGQKMGGIFDSDMLGLDLTQDNLLIL